MLFTRKLIGTLTVAGVAATLAGTAWAGASFGDIDTDGNRLLTEAELVAAFGPRGSQLMKMDTDSDGAITAEEVRLSSVDDDTEEHAENEKDGDHQDDDKDDDHQDDNNNDDDDDGDNDDGGNDDDDDDGGDR